MLVVVVVLLFMFGMMNVYFVGVVKFGVVFGCDGVLFVWFV